MACLQRSVVIISHEKFCVYFSEHHSRRKRIGFVSSERKWLKISQNQLFSFVVHKHQENTCMENKKTQSRDIFLCDVSLQISYELERVSELEDEHRRS